jgi:hypothetical protein
MRNRYGDEYTFEKVGENTYTIKGDLNYWRFGGKEGQQGIDDSDLGFVDPSGGPFISMGYMIEGRAVKRISLAGDEILFEVE